MIKSDFCILYSNKRPENQYVARSGQPLSQQEWQSVIDRACERWRQIDLFMSQGIRMPVALGEGEMEAYDNGTVGMFRWMFPEFAVSRTIVPRALYDPYS